MYRPNANTARINNDISKRSVLADKDAAFLTKLGFAAPGLNSVVPNGAAWLGEGGPYTVDFSNNSTEPVIMTVWTGMTSWVNANTPQLTFSLPPKKMQTVSFAEGASGAWAPVYPTTKLVMGQISETWGEFTFAGIYTTIDVSREVNMSGRGMQIKTPNCVSDMYRCVFVCTDGSKTCLDNYTLKNCATGSQPGAANGVYAGKSSGGCSGMDVGAKIKTFVY